MKAYLDPKSPELQELCVSGSESYYALCEGGRSSKRERADVAELLKKKRVESVLRLEDKLSRAVAAPAWSAARSSPATRGVA